MSCRVLIVDDSGFVRKLLTEVLSRDPAIEVVGAARDPYEARELIKKLNPDVLTLDVEMPRMDGITFLTNLMRLRPMPVVMVSSLTAAGADATMAALQTGAVDFVTKPSLDLSSGLHGLAAELIAKVKSAAAEKRTTRTRSLHARSGASTKIASRWNAVIIAPAPRPAGTSRSRATSPALAGVIPEPSSSTKATAKSARVSRRERRDQIRSVKCMGALPWVSRGIEEV